jgi:hypothetical protein
MDIDEHRLSIVGGFTQRMVQAWGSPFKVVLTTDQRQSVAGSRYVITQLRVGQMQARGADEYLGQRHGLIGQETTGVGGMVKALRTIPVILQIASDMRELAKPGALLVNFTNPAELVTQALDQYALDVESVAGSELGELAKAVIRQLKFQSLKFDVLLVDSMFEGGQLLIDPMRETIQQRAPVARLVRLNVPPVVGVLLIGMQVASLRPNPEIRKKLTGLLS